MSRLNEQKKSGEQSTSAESKFMKSDEKTGDKKDGGNTGKDDSNNNKNDVEKFSMQERQWSLKRQSPNKKFKQR